MLKLQIKLSSRETVLVVLVVVVLGMVIALRLLMNTEVEAQELLTASVRRAGLVLEQTKLDADLVPLETKERQLTEAIAKMPPLQTEKGEVALALWRWAASTNTKIQTLAYTTSTTKVLDTNVVTLRYALVLRGDAKALHGFVASVTSSSYNPLVEVLSVKHELGQGNWEMNLVILFYS